MFQKSAIELRILYMSILRIYYTRMSMYTTAISYLILSMKLLEQFHYAMTGPCLWYFLAKRSILRL